MKIKLMNAPSPMFGVRTLGITLCLIGTVALSGCTGLVTGLSKLSKLEDISGMESLPSSRNLSETEQVRASYPLSDAHSIDLSTQLDAKVYISDTPRLEVIAPSEERLSHLYYALEDSKLTIYDNAIKQRKKSLRAEQLKQELKHCLAINLYLTQLQALSLSGTNELEFVSPIVGNTLSIDSSGASSIEGLTVQCQRLDIDLSGAASVKGSSIQAQTVLVDATGAVALSLEGQAHEINADVSGASSLKFNDLIANKVTIDVSGACSANVYASDTLNCDASGVVSVSYYGSPRVANISKSGMASVQKH